MELLLILIPIFIFVVAKMLLDQRGAARMERVRLLEEALKNPTVDRGTLETLAYQLTGARPVRTAGPSRTSAVILAIGWVGLFTGIGLWVMGEMVHSNGAIAGGIITSIAAFGFVTYPFALRELEARRSPQ